MTGGRHGYGAKLTNAFSKEFVVEIRDGHGTRGGRSNDQRTLTVGRHGYRTKLTNVFLKEFVVEIRDSHGTRRGEDQTISAR